MTFVVCPLCRAQRNVLPPHVGPCPLAVAEHRARIASLAAERRYWLALAAAADRGEALPVTARPEGPG